MINNTIKLYNEFILEKYPERTQYNNEIISADIKFVELNNIINCYRIEYDIKDKKMRLLICDILNLLRAEKVEGEIIKKAIEIIKGYENENS